MTRRAVVDATPLIYFAKLGIVHRLPALYDTLLVPRTVHREVVVAGKEKGAPDATTLEHAFARRVLRVTRDVPVPAEVPSSLDAGERAAIALALRRGCDLLIDEREGYTLARALGLRPRRTTALLLEGVARGLWDARQFGALLRRLVSLGYFLTADLYEDLLREAREVPRRR